MIRLLFISAALAIVITSCSKYHKGDMYTSTMAGDSQQYIILKKGSGEKLIEAANLKIKQSEIRGDECDIIYLSDTSKLSGKKSLLLINTKLPDKKDDFLEKGFFGSFGTKQLVTLIWVSQEDIERYFKKTMQEQ